MFIFVYCFFQRLEIILDVGILGDNADCSKGFFVLFCFFSGDKNLVGSEVKIYSLDPSTQWFSATIVNGNPASKTLQVNCEEVKEDANCV